ncbi:transglycosylase family protein [Streptomyces sp. NPDC001070]
MLKSGNGRHRKPRQAPTAVVAVAATGAGLTLPLFAASGASAADANSTWNAVAVCESGGLWSANTGNGFYGGLQITEETWEQYGGTQYAERPDLASRNEQISVAEKILGELGPDAWSSCAESAGLTDALLGLLHGGDGGNDTATDPGSATGDESADGSTSGDGTQGTTRGTGDDTGAATDAGGTKRPDASATASAEDEGKGSGKHRKPDTGIATDGTSTGDTTDSTGVRNPGHAGLPPQFVEGQAAWGVIPRATDTRTETKKADTRQGGGTTAKSTAGGRYLVQEGDSLCEIAMEQHVPGGWRGLYAANRDVIGDDPNMITSGQYLDLGR